jgi:hypothetical protein
MGRYTYIHTYIQDEELRKESSEWQLGNQSTSKKHLSNDKRATDTVQTLKQSQTQTQESAQRTRWIQNETKASSPNLTHPEIQILSFQDTTNKEGKKGKRRKKRGNGWVGAEHPNTPTEEDALPRIEVGLLGLNKILAKILASRREISLATKPHAHTHKHLYKQVHNNARLEKKTGKNKPLPTTDDFTSNSSNSPRQNAIGSDKKRSLKLSLSRFCLTVSLCVLTPLIAPSCNTHFQPLLLSFDSSSKATKIATERLKG